MARAQSLSRRTFFLLPGACFAVAVLALAAPAPVRTGSLAGTVFGPHDRPLSGARVTIQRSDGRTPLAMLTNSQGHFVFHYLRPGLWDARAYASGNWSEWTHNLEIRAGGEAQVTLRIALLRPPSGISAGIVREWAVPSPNDLPHDPAVAPDGTVWLTLMKSNQLARFTPETGEWKLFPVPTQNSGPHGLVADAAGNIWFTENTAGKIGKLNPATGHFDEYNAPPWSDPHTPVIAPDGALWFTAQQANLIVRMDMRSGAMRSFKVPTAGAHPYGIIVGPDNLLWFCEFGANKLARIDPSGGAIVEYAIPEANARPRRLVALGNAIYFSDFAGGRLGRFNLTDLSFQLWPSPSGVAAHPYGIAADDNGLIWYNEFSANRLVRFDPKTGRFSHITLPSPRSEIRNMARDSSGRIWMALSGADKLAMIQP